MIMINFKSNRIFFPLDEVPVADTISHGGIILDRMSFRYVVPITIYSEGAKCRTAKEHSTIQKIHGEALSIAQSPISPRNSRNTSQLPSGLPITITPYSNAVACSEKVSFWAFNLRVASTYVLTRTILFFS